MNVSVLCGPAPFTGSAKHNRNASHGVATVAAGSAVLCSGARSAVDCDPTKCECVNARILQEIGGLPEMVGLAAKAALHKYVKQSQGMSIRSRRERKLSGRNVLGTNVVSAIAAGTLDLWLRHKDNQHSGQESEREREKEAFRRQMEQTGKR